MVLINFFNGSLKEFDMIVENKKEALKIARSWVIENGSSNISEYDNMIISKDCKGNWITYSTVKEYNREEEDSFDGLLPGDR